MTRGGHPPPSHLYLYHHVYHLCIQPTALIRGCGAPQSLWDDGVAPPPVQVGGLAGEDLLVVLFGVAHSPTGSSVVPTFRPWACSCAMAALAYSFCSLEWYQIPDLSAVR